MQFKHAPAAVSAVFDDPNLVSAAGLVPMLRLAQQAGLAELAQGRLSVPTDKGANAGAKVSALVAGMLAGADSIDDMNVLRHGGRGRCSTGRMRRRRWDRSCGSSGSGTSVNSTPSPPVFS